MLDVCSGRIKSKRSAENAWKQMNSVFALGPEGRGNIPQYAISRDPTSTPQVGTKLEALNTGGPKREFIVTQFSENNRNFAIDVIGDDGSPSRTYSVQVRESGDQAEIELKIKNRLAQFPYIFLQALLLPFGRQMLINPILHSLADRVE